MDLCRLYTSNRMEVLAQLLCEKISQKFPGTAFDKETIIVQNRGMQRWISMEIASRLGICFNCHFPFPNLFIQEIFSKVIPEVSEQDLFSVDFLTWKIAKTLPQLLDNSAFSQLSSYLDASNSVNNTPDSHSETYKAIKVYQLSQKIADQFDHYTVYRPDMVLDWELGHDTHWQSELWRQLTKNCNLHRARLRKKLLEILSEDNSLIKFLPKRVFVFGISALPPFHTSIIIALSRYVEVNFFILNPSAEYWDDIVSEKEIKAFYKKQVNKKKRPTPAIQDFHLEQGHPLLASMGKYGRDFLSLLHDFTQEEYPYPVQTEDKTLLSYLHSRILNFTNTHDTVFIDEHDRSLQVHCCHSPMREIEILYDNLLLLFKEQPALHASDIVVMTPDIERYAPYIEAVFGCPEDNAKKISFSLADRAIGTESTMARIFLSLLEIPGSRFNVTIIMDLLQSPVIQQAFSITNDDYRVIKSWILGTGIRWGIDQTTREQLHLPASMDNTWKAGIDSLLLGYALPSEGWNSFNNIAGYDHVEGSQGIILGKLLDFFLMLVDLSTLCEKSYTLQCWSELLMNFFNPIFIKSPEFDQEILFIKSILVKMISIQNQTDYDVKIPLEVVKLYLKKNLSQCVSSPGFLSGGVTFCAMLPMRSIPFKIVCILGLNNDTFPRRSVTPSWDLISSNPQKGDRSLEIEDRYLFLEALLSARSILYISYTGQNTNGNSPERPSVLVEELLDYIDTQFVMTKKKSDCTATPPLCVDHHPHTTIASLPVAGIKCSIRNYLVTNHFLQAFNPAYFSGDYRYISFSQDNFEAAKTRKTEISDEMSFFANKLPEPSLQCKSITVNDLLSFFSNPCRYLLHKRLGITLDSYMDKFLNDEPFELKGIASYQMAEELTERIIDGYNNDDLYNHIKLTNKLPHGSIGKYHYDKLSSGVIDFAGKISAWLQDRTLPDLTINVSINDFNLCGTLDRIRENSQVRFRYAKLKGTDLLTSWIKHLLLNYCKPENYPSTSVLFTSNASVLFSMISDCQKHLEYILKTFWRGLCSPIQFIPECSWIFAENILVKKKSEEIAMNAAQKRWNGDTFLSIPGESANPYNRLCYHLSSPFGEDFKTTALEIFGPIISNSKILE